MKVLHLYKYYHPFIGGIENHVRVLATELSRSSRVRALVSSHNGCRGVERREGVTVVRLPRYGSALSTPLSPGLLPLLRRMQADVAHIHLAHPLGMCALLALPREKRPAIVASYHMDVSARSRSCGYAYRPLLRRFLAQTDAILLASPAMKTNSPILDDLHERCEVVPYGIDVTRFNKTPEIVRQAGEIRQGFGNRPIVLFVGRLVYYKGVDVLLKAARDIDAIILIVGSGPLETKMREAAEGIPNVVLAGSVADRELPAYYHACDVFALPSTAQTEAFGLVQLEAMAAGKPVVCTELGTGTSWVNQHGVTGFVVPPRDPEALANAIGALLRDADLRREMGRKGQARVEEEFTKEKMAERTLEVYRKVLDN